MAVTKKTVSAAAKAAAQTEVKKTLAPTTPVKTESESVAVSAEAAKTEPSKKASAKKEPVKGTEAKKAPAVKNTVKATAKKDAVKKAATKKAELKSQVHVQFEGKSYSQEELLKIAKDVWRYDLKQKAGDLTSIELYVKPEESMVYYVMNGEQTGSFYI